MKKIFVFIILLIPFLGISQNNAPVASNVSAATVKNTNATIHLVASDADFDSLTYSIVSNPSNGTASLSGDTVTYTPSTDFQGTDTFTFKANDGIIDSSTKIVTVKVIDGYKTTQNKLGDDIDGEAASDLLGWSVSFNEDNTIMAIGAPYNDGTASNAGHVRLYKYNGSSWTKLGSDIDGEAWDDYSGIVSLSSDGTIVAIGAYYNDGTASNAGHVRVYQYVDSAWTKLGSDIDGESADDRLGTSVSLSSDGTIVAIGAPNNDGTGSDGGHVRVYKYNGSAWTKLGDDIDGEAADDRSGKSVSLSSDGTIVAIGAYNNDGTASNAGHVRLYKYNGSNWTKLGSDIDGEAASDYSGYSVSLSSDGTIVAIGAPDNDGTGSDAGHVRVYNLIDDSNDLDEDGILNDDDKCPNTPAGSVVDVNGCAIFTLPVNNNKVLVTSSTCIGKTDGSIGLSVEDNSHDYTITITDKDPVVIAGEDKSTSVTGLGKGTYTVCFKVDGQANYEQCFEVVIAEPKPLVAFIVVDNDKRTTSIDLSGSKLYNVDINGHRHQVKGDNFTTTLPTGLSIIKISTSLDCQGVIEREIFISEDIHYYPNPTDQDVSVHASGEDTRVQVSVFSEKGDLIYTQRQQIQDFSRKIKIDLSRQITGTYIVVMDGPTVRKTFKIIRK